MARLDDDATNMNRSSKRALTGARGNQDVVGLNRAEFRIAIDPRPDNVERTKKDIETQLTAIETGIANIAETRDQRARDLLAGVRAALILFVPNFIVFLVLQSKVITTMAHSGIKG